MILCFNARFASFTQQVCSSVISFEVIFHFECVDDVGECGAPLKNKIKFIIEFKNDD